MTSHTENVWPFPKLVGIEIKEASGKKVVGTLKVRHDLCTHKDTLHGGAIMTLADALGAVGATLGLPKDAPGTATSESKTNFLRPIFKDDTVTAESVAIYEGRRLSVWQTKIHRGDGKLAAIVLQTQTTL